MSIGKTAIGLALIGAMSSGCDNDKDVNVSSLGEVDEVVSSELQDKISGLVSKSFKCSREGQYIWHGPNHTVNSTADVQCANNESLAVAKARERVVGSVASTLGPFINVSGYCANAIDAKICCVKACIR